MTPVLPCFLFSPRRCFCHVDFFRFASTDDRPGLAQAAETIDANHERITQVLVTGPPEVVKAETETLRRFEASKLKIF